MANKYVYKFLILFFLFGFLSFSQIISINAPTYGFSQACASSSFNSFSVDFSFTGSANNPLNQFIVQLSDDNFVNNIIVIGTTSPGVITSGGSYPISNLSIPSQQSPAPLPVYGSNYKLRVVSTANPVSGTSTTLPLSVYYLIHNQKIILNTEPSNSITSCNSSYTITINDVSITPSSPRQYPSLKYKWYTAAGVLVQSSLSPSYTVQSNAPGQYYVQTDYGTCNSSSLSKSSIVTVSFTNSSSLTINTTPPNTTTYCSGDTVALSGSLPASSSYTYKWFNNGVQIPGATASTYPITTTGSYRLEVDTGGCNLVSNTLDILPSPITASLNLTSPANLAAGQTLSLIVSTTANSPSYQWYSVNSGVTTQLLGETSSTLLVNQTGTYQVIVKQNIGCITTKTLLITIKSGNGTGGRDELPNLISPDNDGVNDTWVLPSYITSVAPQIKVEILNEYGKQVYITDNYKNDWPDTDVVIPKTNPVFYFIISAKDQVLKQGTITVIK